MAFKVVTQTVVSARTSSLSGTATVLTLTTVGGVPIYQFDELLIELEVTGALAGTAPTMDIYLQRAVQPAPDPAVNANWDDLTHFTQVAVGTTPPLMVHLFATHPGLGTAASASAQVWTRAIETLAAGNLQQGHWGAQLRIREVMGGTVTTGAVYNIHVTGTQYRRYG